MYLSVKRRAQKKGPPALAGGPGGGRGSEQAGKGREPDCAPTARGCAPHPAHPYSTEGGGAASSLLERGRLDHEGAAHNTQYDP